MAAPLNYLFIDFEYNSSNEENLNLVCLSCSLTNPQFEELHQKDIWIYLSEMTKAEFRKYLTDMKHIYGDFIVLCWSANAEGRSFIAAGVNPREHKWIDLQAEYKMLTNHWHKYMYGPQMSNGKVVTTIPPRQKFQMTEEEQKKAYANRPETNLVAASFKLLGVQVDSVHKTKMRDIIIRNDEAEIMENKEEIMKYCASDIKYLPMMFKEIIKIYTQVNKTLRIGITKEEMMWRGRSVVNTAIVENNGYPVNFDWAVNFTNNVPKMQLEICRDIDSQFEEGLGPFAFDSEKTKVGDLTLKVITPKRRIKYWKEWIAENCDTRRWLKTGTVNKITGKYGLSTSYEAWTRYFNVPRHSYERGNFAHQIVRYLNFNKNLNGFLPAKKGKAKFIDFFGSDGRVRGFLNSYGAQSARWQPKSVSFLFLKSAWLRSMCMSKPGKFICGIDYSQQEFLISMLLAGDMAGQKAYETGDVYLHTAKLAGAVPKDATKKSHPKERDIYKAVTLAISYMMSCFGLSDTLTQSLKREVDHDEAQDFIDDFNDVYSDFAEFMEEEVVGGYESQKYMKSADGWVMFGDNENFRSYGNCPIQNRGSDILRKALDMCLEAGLTPIFPLHDALYIEGDIENRDEIIIKFNKIMKEAFAFYFPDKKKVEAMIRTDINIWGPDCEDKDFKIDKLDIKSQSVYIDPRSEDEYSRFKKYMETDS